MVKDKKKIKKFKIFFIIFIIIMTIGLVKKTFQNDTFYTIKIGELILKNGIDMMDHFSFHQGLPYTYPHWLYDLFIYLIYASFGYTGIYISSIIVFIILVLIVFKTNITICKNYSMAAFSTFLCALSISGFITARAQSISYLIFALEILFIEKFLENGKKKYLGGLLILSLVLCNMHVAVWPFYFILYLPYLVEYLISLIISKIKKKNKIINLLEKKFIFEKNENIKYLFLTMIISPITGLLTPIKDTPYTYLIKTMMGNSQKYINEHKMISWLESPFTIIITLETFFLAIFSKIKLRDLFLVCGLSLMSIISIRHIALLSLGGTIVFSRIFTIFLDNYRLNIDEKVINFFNKNYIIIIFLLSITIFSSFMLDSQTKKDFIDKKTYPIDAVKYIKENIDISSMRIFNEYTFGSYLILNDIPVFIDSRADLYTKQFNGLDYDIFDDWINIPSNWSEKFNFYNITHILVYKEESSFYKIFENYDNYQVLYEDEYFILIERQNAPQYRLNISNKTTY